MTPLRNRAVDSLPEKIGLSDKAVGGTRSPFVSLNPWLCRLCLPAGVSFRPVLDRQPFEAAEVLVICRRQHKPVHMGNRGDLTVDERRRPAARFKPRPLVAVPRRRRLVVRQNRKRSVHDVTEIGFERGPAPAFWQPPTPIRELVPDWRRNCALGTTLVQTLKNRRVRSLRDRGRNDARVQKISGRHRDTLRPVVLSRVEAAKSSSTPISSRECFSRNFLYASPKCKRLPRSRSNSRRETRTATGRPRRVNSTSTPASAWSTILGRRDLASAIEYRCDMRQVYIEMYMSATGTDDRATDDPAALTLGLSSRASEPRTRPSNRPAGSTMWSLS